MVPSTGAANEIENGDFKNVGSAEFQSHEPGSGDIDTTQHVKAKKHIDGLSKNAGATPRM